MKELKCTKIIPGILLGIFALIGVFFAPIQVKAEELQDANGVTWSYEFIEESTTDIAIEMTEGGLPGAFNGHLAIPSQIGTFTVKKLAYNCIYSAGEEQRESITSVSVGDTIKEIDTYAFDGCTNMRSITWSKENIEKMGESVFKNCAKLTSIELPTNSSFRVINDNMFDGCTKLSTITIPSQIYKISDYAFSSSGLQYITIPNTVTSLGKNVFASCEKLVSVTLPSNDSLTEIPESTFDNTPMLKTIDIPATYESIGQWAFSNTGIIGITLPSTITDINEEAFQNCRNMKYIQFTSTSVPSFNADEHFYGDYESLIVITPKGCESTYKTAMMDANNTLALPEKVSFLGNDTKITVVPLLSGEVKVSGTLYAGKALSTLKLSGTFLNALTNTPITGSLSFTTPSKTYQTGYTPEDISWTFIPSTSYGAGALQAKGTVPSIYVEPVVVVKKVVKVIVKKPATPTLKSLKKKKKKLTVSWKKAITGCKGYQVFVSTKKGSGYKVKATVKKASAKSVVIKGLKKGKTYFIKMRAYKVVSGKKVYSKYSKIKRIKM